MEERMPEVKERLNEVIGSVEVFANTILENPESYTISEIEIANCFRMAIIFYRARERGEDLQLPTLERLNEMVNEELKKVRNEKEQVVNVFV